MICIYTPRNSNGARDLAEAITLQGTLCRRTKGRLLQNLQPTDAVVCWGHHFAADPGQRTLNNVPHITKFQEARRLAEAGVATVQVSLSRPAAVNTTRAAFVPAEYTLAARSRNLSVADVSRLQGELEAWTRNEQTRRTAWQNQPAQPVETWLARRNNHIGGNDLLTPPATPDFYSKKENLTEEYRLHMFKGRSIRAGRKIQTTQRGTPHAWIRSYDAGWIINYEGFSSTRPMRDLATAALTALGLDFGAVDIGLKANGTLMVLEVNRAPGIENNTTTTYATHIISWLNGGRNDQR